MKKKYLLIILLGILLIIIALILSLTVKEVIELSQAEESDNKFNIYKIHYYSDIGTINNQTTYQNPEWNLNVYLYTDIAIYVERTEEYDSNNYIKSIYIDNISFSGDNTENKKLYYLSPLNFGNDEITDELEENEIAESLEYNIVNDENEDNDMKYTLPIFFQDCSNPITLRFINNKILENYIVSSSEIVSFDGSLLKNANVALKDIETTIYLNVNILTQDGITHTIQLNLDIPLENEENDIYEGSVEVID